MKTQCTIQQGFSKNATATYKASGLLGHSGVDESCGYGTPINCYHNNAYVYKVLDENNPSNDGSGFTGVFTIVENELEVFEFLYGHCDPKCAVGANLTIGDVLGAEANHGEVYSDGVRITLEMQKSGDKRGAHRHNQKRVLRKDKQLLPNTNYLTDKNGYLYRNGFFYAVPYYTNGFNGCVDWALPLFNRNLTLGMGGYDVLVLQRFLKWKGFFQGDCTEFFGPKTLSSVIAFQRANGLTPAVGFWGEKSRAKINSIIYGN